MEITYDLIIKYLVNNNDNNINNNETSTQKNFLNYSINFPEKIKSFFTNKFYRYGISNNSSNNNLSFWLSLIILLEKENILNSLSSEFELFCVVPSIKFSILSDKLVLLKSLSFIP